MSYDWSLLIPFGLIFLTGCALGALRERRAWHGRMGEKLGEECWHRTWGRVMVVWCHPHDGACLIIERQETTDPDDDEHVFDTCERSDLTPLPDRRWPYLGFTKPSSEAA